jgi:hypothetical protein
MDFLLELRIICESPFKNEYRFEGSQPDRGATRETCPEINASDCNREVAEIESAIAAGLSLADRRQLKAYGVRWKENIVTRSQ